MDTLNAHFSLGSEDTEGYFAPSDRYALSALIPAGETLTSPGVHAFWEWIVRCELPYKVLFDETMNERTDDILGNVDDPEEDILINCTDPDNGMVERLAKAENPMLLVLSTEGKFDDVAAGAAAAALREGIPVHDLSRMLLEVTWQHLPDHEPPEEAALEVEADGQTALTVVSDAPDVTLTAQEAATVNQALIDTEGFIDVVFGQMVNSAAELRQDLIRARSVLAPKPEIPADTEDGTKPRKTRLEIFNEKSGQWEPAGRGRPPKDAQTRRVPA
ncbi:hypothetical protein DMB38_20160 [Streptomyces sp. WAC 06738]|uniref:hypothetical protein n=1 Tax=Streptomyces sp. WAC 06738 TaxID=2203210 RepID=UPI000F71746F|nr:hypothetical protein [Streptomyces sp. WAC 06738]AZM47792.1 hypothetical protein DMB38_20160 [Streptomyces sp. WAC 06738]